MRLTDCNHATLHALTRSGEHSANFNGVVAIIVDDRNAAHFANLGEAPLDAAKASKALGYPRVINIHFKRNRNRGKRILDVVPPRHWQTNAINHARRSIARTH